MACLGKLCPFYFSPWYPTGRWHRYSEDCNNTLPNLPSIIRSSGANLSTNWILHCTFSFLNIYSGYVTRKNNTGISQPNDLRAFHLLRAKSFHSLSLSCLTASSGFDIIAISPFSSNDIIISKYESEIKSLYFLLLFFHLFSLPYGFILWVNQIKNK